MFDCVSVVNLHGRSWSVIVLDLLAFDHSLALLRQCGSGCVMVPHIKGNYMATLQ